MSAPWISWYHMLSESGLHQQYMHWNFEPGALWLFELPDHSWWWKFEHNDLMVFFHRSKFICLWTWAHSWPTSVFHPSRCTSASSDKWWEVANLLCTKTRSQLPAASCLHPSHLLEGSGRSSSEQTSLHLSEIDKGYHKPSKVTDL